MSAVVRGVPLNAYVPRPMSQDEVVNRIRQVAEQLKLEIELPDEFKCAITQSCMKNPRASRALQALAALQAWQIGECRIASRFETQIDAKVVPTSISAEEWARPQLLLDELPPYPQAMQDFLEGPDPFDSTKKAKETHFVVPLLKNFTLNDGTETPRTLKNLNALDKATGGIGCRYIWDEVLLDPANDKPAEVGFQWAVMTKDVVPESRSQIYTAQKDLVESKGYEVPGFLDAATCILWEHRFSGNCLFKLNTLDMTSYTRCKEKIDGWQVAVGAFATISGLSVIQSGVDKIFGMAGLRKF